MHSSHDAGRGLKLTLALLLLAIGIVATHVTSRALTALPAQHLELKN